MRSPKQRSRALVIFTVLIVASAGVYLMLSALEENITFFVSPSEIETKITDNRPFRLGGLVEEGSISHPSAGTIAFRVADETATQEVLFHGTVPDLFKEGQGVVAEGILNGEQIFVATRLLAKHDETYQEEKPLQSLAE